MSKEFEFRRHSIKDGPKGHSIGPKGYQLARAVGERQLRGRGFTHFFSSTYWRTVQTMAAFAEGAGDFAMTAAPPFSPIYLLGDGVREMWHVCRQAELQGQDMVGAAFTKDDAMARMIAADCADLFRTWAAGLDDGTKALVVGHSPSLELMLHGLTGVRIAGLAECQGFRIIVADDEVSCLHGTPDLDPSEIRSALAPAPRSFC
jgi:broad specificity phosphatase PhoE